MAKKTLYKFLATGLAAIILITSIGISIDVHFCQGKLKSFALIGKAKTCHQKTSSIQCHNSKRIFQKNNSKSICKKNCCKNSSFSFQNNLEKTITIESNILNHNVFCALVFVFFLENKFVSFSNNFKNYIPPLLNRNIFVLIQSFLL